jgi:3-isopropylmalate dehydrogenase
MRAFRIAVFEGDGIGPEVMAPARALLQGLAETSGAYAFDWQVLPAGAGHYAATGEALPAASVAAARAADAIFLSAMGLPHIRYPDGTEIMPQVELRMIFDLYAGVRPVRIVPGWPTPLNLPEGRVVDYVLVRESTEGLFHTQGKGVVEADEARETLRITRAVTEKLSRFGFDLARQRARPNRKVTCVDKANAFHAFAFMRGIFDGVAAENPDVAADHAYVDAMALYLVQRPEVWDVMVTENIFGDILSDLGAGLMGGLGMAPSADIGDDHAVFQPCHGTAPDIAGKGLANPVAMILSGAMMLDWLAAKHGVPRMAEDAERLRAAVDRVVAEGRVRTRDIGGTAGTGEMAAAIGAALPG